MPVLARWPRKRPSAGAIREENGEVVESEPAVDAYRRRAGPLLEHDEWRGLARAWRATLPSPCVPSLEAEHRRVVVERAGEVADLQAHVTEPERVGEWRGARPVRPRPSVALRFSASVIVGEVEESCALTQDGYPLEPRPASAGTVRAGSPENARLARRGHGQYRRPVRVDAGSAGQRTTRPGAQAEGGINDGGCLVQRERHVDTERGATPGRSGTRARSRRESRRRRRRDALGDLRVRGSARPTMACFPKRSSSRSSRRCARAESLHRLEPEAREATRRRWCRRASGATSRAASRTTSASRSRRRCGWSGTSARHLAALSLLTRRRSSRGNGRAGLRTERAASSDQSSRSVRRS